MRLRRKKWSAADGALQSGKAEDEQRQVETLYRPQPDDTVAAGGGYFDAQIISEALT